MNLDNLKQKYEFFRIPQFAQIAFAVFLIMGFSVCRLLSHSWDTRVDYSFGYIAPLFILYVLFDRKEKIFAYFNSQSLPIAENKVYKFLVQSFFGSMFICGLAVYAMFMLLFAMTQNWGICGTTATFGFCFLSFSLAYLSSATNSKGEKKSIKDRLGFTSLFVFPCFALLVAAPMFSVIETKISLFLLSKVALITKDLMDSLGYIVELRGNVLVFPNGQVGVADACSGIRSLTACLFAGTFLAAVFLPTFWKKVCLVLASMMLAFFNNILRALFLSLYAYENGPESISGFVHDAAGYFVLGMTIIGLLILIPIFQLNPVPKEFRVNQESKNGKLAEDTKDNKNEGELK